MTREDVLKLFPDATDEQITNLLNQNNKEVAAEKTKAEKYKEDAKKAGDLQTELDRINAEKMTDAEKQAADLKKANDKIAELEKNQAISAQRSSVMEKFNVTGEQAKQIVKDDGSFDTDVLGQIISDKEKAAATAKEQEIAKGATNPGGGSAGSGDGKSGPENIAAKLFTTKKADNSVLSHYLNGGN